MDRLFGRKTKKSTASNSSPSNPTVTNEEEGFAIVNTPPPPPPLTNSAFQSPYPILNPTASNASELVSSSSAAAASGVSSGASSSGGSSSSAFLDGIPFVLSSRCQGGNDLDEVVARVESIAERVKNVDWSASNYDFRLERSVLSQELPNAVQQMHIN